MHRFSTRLLLLIGGTIVFAAAAFALVTTTNYKPWGVHDSRREDYEAKLAQLAEETRLEDEFRNEDKPTIQVGLANGTCDFRWLSPGDTAVSEFPIRNVGEKPLSVSVGQLVTEGLSVEMEQDEIQPGEFSMCRVSWKTPENTSVRRDRERGEFSLHSNDPLNAKKSITVTGRVRKQLRYPSELRLGREEITKQRTAEFVIYSQLWENFAITEIANKKSNVKGKINWVADDLKTIDPELIDKEPKGIKQVTVIFPAIADYGEFSGDFEITVEKQDSKGENLSETRQTFSIPYLGSVQSPIAFYGPKLDFRTGLDLGNLTSGKQHDFFVTVRVKGDKSRSVTVLGVEPKQLQCELTPQKTVGSYRLRISVPADCPDLQFNRDDQSGYVHIGDPESNRFSNWLPLTGVVSSAKRN